MAPKSVQRVSNILFIISYILDHTIGKSNMVPQPSKIIVDLFVTRRGNATN